MFYICYRPGTRESNLREFSLLLIPILWKKKPKRREGQRLVQHHTAWSQGYLFYFKYILCCIHLSVYVCAHSMCGEADDKTGEVGTLLLLPVSWALNSGHPIWQQAHFSCLVFLLAREFFFFHFGFSETQFFCVFLALAL